MGIHAVPRKKPATHDARSPAKEESVLTTPAIVDKATATFRASLGGNNPHHIWAALGLHIEQHLKQRKAVRIADFGVFGVDQDGSPTFTQDLVFLHMTRLSSTSRKGFNCNDNVVDIDPMAVAAEYLQNCSKDLVRAVIASVLAWVTAWAKDGEAMRVEFLPLGEWKCTGERVEFTFSRSFCEEMAAALKAEGLRDAEPSPHSSGNQDEQSQASRKIQDETWSRTGNTQANKENGACNSAEETRAPSPTATSRYKMRAPTRSSIAKQRAPHQRRSTTTPGDQATVKHSKARVAPSRRVEAAKKTAESRRLSFSSAEVDAVTRDIIAVTTRPASRGLRTSKSSHKSVIQLSPRQAETIDRLRKRIINRRSQLVRGLNAVAAVFSSFQDGGASSTELSIALRKLGVKISLAELKEVSAAFAHRKRGLIDTEKLFGALRGPPMSPERLEVVSRVFRCLDPSTSGAICIDELVKFYDVGVLPSVRSGTQTRLDALTSFLNDWRLFTVDDANTITFEAFVAYYQNVSACIEADAEFARFMAQAWRIVDENPSEETQGTQNPAVFQTNSAAPVPTLDLPTASPSSQNRCTVVAPRREVSPAEAWTYLRQLLLPQTGLEGVNRLPTLDNMSRRLCANRILGDGNETMNAKAFGHSLAVLDKRLQPTQIHDLSQLVASQCADTLRGGDTISLKLLYRKLMSVRTQEVIEPVESNSVELFAARTMSRIRAHVFGADSDDGNTGSESHERLKPLEKSLRLSSSNAKESVLAKFELRTGLRKVGIEVTFQELDYLFAYFDVDRDGFIDLNSFLEVLCSGKMPQRTMPRQASKAEVPDPVVAYYTPPTLPATLSSQGTRQRMQTTSRVQPNFRRRNLIHRAIWEPSKPAQPAAIAPTTNALDAERRCRYRAAQRIQTIFRGFRSRQLAAHLRRKLAASHRRVASERRPAKHLVRTALPTAYGF